MHQWEHVPAPWAEDWGTPWASPVWWKFISLITRSTPAWLSPLPSLSSPPLQKVFASRKELLEYDLQQREAASKSSRSAVQPTFTASQYRALSVLGCGHTSSTKCYGCASAVTEHCITLLRALATNAAIRHILVSQGLIRELFDYNLRRGAASMREDIRQLMCLLTRWASGGCLPFLFDLSHTGTQAASSAGLALPNSGVPWALEGTKY